MADKDGLGKQIIKGTPGATAESTGAGIQIIFYLAVGAIVWSLVLPMMNPATFVVLDGLGLPAPEGNKFVCPNKRDAEANYAETKFNGTNFYPGEVVVAFTTKTITYKEKVDGSPKKAPFTAFYLERLPSNSKLLKDKKIFKKECQISRNLQKLPGVGYIEYSILDEDDEDLKEVMKSKLSAELNSRKTEVNFFILTNY